MNGVILYQSKYGATKKYASWLSEETGFPAVETKKAKIEEIQLYDVIILGGGIYASGIAGLSFLKKHIGVLKGKKIAVFCVGASPYEEKAVQAVYQHNMKDQLADIPCFYCRGAWDVDAMNLVDRNLCKMLRKAVAKKDPSEYEVWEQALMATGEESCDWTDPKYLEPILEMLK
ncbi:MAG: flavodoxin domain-containing protein [Candidatus Onthomonas sp.]|nr:flavodoxin domain-containing protein [Candidatus Onthomonas sp.]